MERNLLNLVAAIIQRSSRERPADSVLRSELKIHRLPAVQSAYVSRSVFTYYRWFGWLNQREELSKQFERALELAQGFAQNPMEFSDKELKARGVPSWLEDEMEISPDWVRAIQAEPKIWLRARSGQGRALASKLGDCKVFGAGSLVDILEYQGHRDLFRTPEFHAGEFELQDISSQAVGLICAPQSGQTWWDACAGEGGKTLHLSDLMENKGLIWVSDRAEWRLRKLKRRTARARVFNYRTRVWNGEPKLPTKTLFDGVLVDAPCTGIGTWQRNPHARWTTVPGDIRELAELQKRLLIHAAAAVKPGGKLVFSACTLTRTETLGVVKEVQQGTELKPLAVSNPLAPSSGSSTLSFLPQQFGGNGMFLAAWSR